MAQLKFVFFGLSITSSWGNGHATTYRALLRGLAARGHDILFLERDVPWYAAHRDQPDPSFARTRLYSSLEECRELFDREVREADVVVQGSYVPEGVALGKWITETSRGLTAFYDIDTPVTMAKLAAGDYEYLTPALIPRFDLYLSFTGGPLLREIEQRYGASRARPLYCSVDPDLYFEEPGPIRWDMGYLGTYSADRQPGIEHLLCRPAKLWPEGRFAVAGSLYPDNLSWPSNVERIEHLPPAEHRAFYNSQRFTLNITRTDMARAGYSPSVRLFEAGACGTAIMSDHWPGIETLLRPGFEILIVRSTGDALRLLKDLHEEEWRQIGQNGRRRVLACHTGCHRALELEQYALEAIAERAVRA